MEIESRYAAQNIVGIGLIVRTVMLSRSRWGRLNAVAGARSMSMVGSVQNLSQCAGRPAMSSRCKSDTMKE
jgi:hypothetical protein